MAPEQANAQEVDARSDLFSLGSVLYRASTNEFPFGCKETLAILSASANKTPKAPNKIDPSLPRAFSDLIMWLLAKDPADRPQSAQEVVQAIEEIEGDPNPRRGETEDLRQPKVRTVPSSIAPKEVVREESPSSVSPKRDSKAIRLSGVRKKKRPQPKREMSMFILIGAIILLVLALLVFVIGIIRHFKKSQASSQFPSVASLVVKKQSHHE
jgi:serine/threonine protein kinase